MKYPVIYFKRQTSEFTETQHPTNKTYDSSVKATSPPYLQDISKATITPINRNDATPADTPIIHLEKRKLYHKII